LLGQDDFLAPLRCLDETGSGDDLKPGGLERQGKKKSDEMMGLLAMRSRTLGRAKLLGAGTILNYNSQTKTIGTKTPR